MNDPWDLKAINEMDKSSLTQWMSDLLRKEGIFSDTLGGSVSIKSVFTDFYDENLEALFLRETGNLAAVGTSISNLQNLHKLLNFSSISNEKLHFALINSRLDQENHIPGMQVFIHALIAHQVVVFTPKASILALGSTSEWKDLIYTIFKGRVVAIDNLPNEWDSIQLLKQQIEKGVIEQVDGIYLRYRGLIVFGKDLEFVYFKA